MEYNRNFFIAITLSFLLIFAFQYFYPPTPSKDVPTDVSAQKEATSSSSPVSAIPQVGLAGKNDVYSTNDILKNIKQVKIKTPSLYGSINLKGANFDNLFLKKYPVDISSDALDVKLLNQTGLPTGYIAEFGFSSNPGQKLDVPNNTTIWNLIGDSQTLTPDSPIKLLYDNHKGLIFERKISVDKNYMFAIQDQITNKTSEPISLYNYARIARAYPLASNNHTTILHEGPIAMIGKQGLQTETYKKIQELKPDNYGQKQIGFDQDTGGWVGITDKYWAVVAIPDQSQSFTAHFRYFDNLPNHFQTDFLTTALSLNPGETKTITNRLFAGAKEVDILNQYQNNLHIQKFGLLIDWGIFSLITKPMFFLIDWFYKLFGNFGLSILAVTVLLKILTFPLSHKSFVSMARMRVLQPKLAQIKEKYKTPQEQQKATLELYRKEKVNPFAGCLPIIIQMPIFFALYKVLYITIEMRHAPFFGWIHDLAAPDPTSIFNLFGLLPYNVPGFLEIGAWPILMGISMFLQMKLSPAPADAMQAKIFNWFPLIFTFMLSSFPVGLVIYWAWNNTLTIIQQTLIMKQQGVKIELWNNLKKMFSRKKQ